MERETAMEIKETTYNSVTSTSKAETKSETKSKVNRPVQTVASKKNGESKKKKGVFSKTLKGTFLASEKARNIYPFFIFLALLAMVYIFNNYYAEKNHRAIKKLEPIHEAYETGFRNAKAVYEDSSRLSNISKKLESIGLQEARVSPRVLKEEQFK